MKIEDIKLDDDLIQILHLNNFEEITENINSNLDCFIEKYKVDILNAHEAGFGQDDMAPIFKNIEKINQIKKMINDLEIDDF